MFLWIRTSISRIREGNTNVQVSISPDNKEYLKKILKEKLPFTRKHVPLSTLPPLLHSLRSVCEHVSVVWVAGSHRKSRIQAILYHLAKKISSPPKKILNLSTWALKSHWRAGRIRRQRNVKAKISLKRKEMNILLRLPEEWQLFLP